MKQERSCSASFTDAERKCVRKNVEVDRKETLKSSNVEYFKLTFHCFFEKIITKSETVIMFLEIYTQL
jgi:hypothetical protein